MSERKLNEQELRKLQEEAETGDLNHSTLSKRHVRILLSLHFVLSTNEDMLSVPYANLLAIRDLIEYFFGKLYPLEEVSYWATDLLNRGYLVKSEEESESSHYFSLTEKGKELLEEVFHSRESLFESNSKNSQRFMN